MNLFGNRLTFGRILLTSALGALLSEVLLISVSYNFHSDVVAQAFTADQIPKHVVALVVGTIVGWTVELFRLMNNSTLRALSLLDELVRKVRVLSGQTEGQDRALDMLTKSRRHHDVLSHLIQMSMEENFVHIPRIGTPDYLRVLNMALAHADSFQTVHREPLRWFREVPAAAAYLNALRHKQMDVKLRLLILDDGDAEQMEEDVRDASLLDFYWTHTGADLDTFWCRSTDFRRLFPGLSVPDDFVLFDGSLLISYQEEFQLLTFLVVDAASPQTRVFSNWNRLDPNDRERFFHRVPRLPVDARPVALPPAV